MKLAHRIDGPDGAPVVVLANSLGASMAMWEPQVEALAARHRVLRYEHRGHHGSETPPGPYTMDDLGGDVLALCDELGIERFSVIGLSMGGMVGMWLGIHAPSRVERLALLSTSARLGPPEVWHDRIAAVRADGMAAVAETVLARWFTPRYARQRPELVDRFRRMLRTVDPAGYAACCAAVAGMDLRADLPRITAPTLAIAGGDDPSTPPEHLREIAAAIPGAVLEVVEPAAHLSNVEQAKPVTGLLLTHVAGTAAR